MGGVSRFVQNRPHNTQLYQALLRIIPYTFGASNKTKSKKVAQF